MKLVPPVPDVPKFQLFRGRRALGRIAAGSQAIGVTYLSLLFGLTHAIGDAALESVKGFQGLMTNDV